MPIYEYLCGRCQVVTEVTKPLKYLDDPEPCPDEACEGRVMERVIFSIPQIATSGCQHEAQYHPAFGKVLSTKRQIKQEISRIKGETGKEIVEVGNDSLKSIQKKRKNYTLD